MYTTQEADASEHPLDRSLSSRQNPPIQNKKEPNMDRAAKSIAILAAIFLSASPAMAQIVRVSPADMVSVVVDGDGPTAMRAMVVYCRPFTKAPRGNEIRKIWGGLVPYGKVWRTGANEATLFITPVALEVAGTTIPAGTYTLWTLPQADGTAKLIINKQFGQWGESYDEKQDLTRVDLTRTSLDKSVDQFTINMDRDSDGAGFTLKMAWENTQYAVPFKMKK
jgi:hypothetical protein